MRPTLKAHMRTGLTLVFVLLAFATQAFQLSGSVIGSDGYPVAYASVFVKNTTYGVATNLKGQYFLELDAGTHTIVFRAVGYNSIEKEVTVTSNQELDVRLHIKTLELEEVTVDAKAKDPAFAIMKKVVENRRKFMHPVTAFTCSTYVKADLGKEFMRKDTLSREARKLDTLPDFLTRQQMELYESYGLTHWMAPNRFKEIKDAVHDYYNRPNNTISVSIDGDGDSRYFASGSVNKALFKVDQAEAVFNFYESTMDLAALSMVPFVSPASPFGLTSYKFRLEEAFLQDGHMVNKIEVIPRRKGGTLWSGYVYVVEGSWNLKAVDLEADKTSLNHFDYFKVMQEYVPVDSMWMLSREEFFYTTRTGKKAELGHTLIANSDYKLNPEFARNFFKNELRVTTDSAMQRDSSYWEAVRPVTLKADEARFLHQQDSIQQYHESAEYLAEKDSSYNHINIWNFLLTGVGWRNSFKKQSVYFDPLVNAFDPFGVGGIRIQQGGMYEKEFDRAHKIRVGANVNYGTANQDIKGGVRLSYLYNPKRFGRVYGVARNDYSMINSNEALVSIFSGTNYVEDVAFELGHELEVSNGFFVDFRGEYAQKRAIDQLVQNPFFAEVDPRAGPEAFGNFDQFLLNFRLTWIPGNKYYSAPFKKVNLGSKWPITRFTYRKGIPGVLNSTANFDFVELDVEDDVTLGTFGDSRWRAKAGSFLNSNQVYYTDLKFFRGYDPVLFTNPLVNFQLLDSTRTTQKPYIQARYLHRFNGIFLNKIPILKRTKMTSVVGTGSLWISENNFRHAEVFAGLELPFRFQKQLFRIGVYYVVADSNFSEADQQIKIGLDFFNPFTNKWTY